MKSLLLLLNLAFPNSNASQSPFIRNMYQHSQKSPLGIVDFSKMPDSDLSEIENIAQREQSIHWARYSFQASLETALRAQRENRDQEEINNIVENTLNWHFRSLVLAHRDKGIAKDSSIDATGWIHMDHQSRLTYIAELLDGREIVARDYFLPAIEWTREHTKSWPLTSHQDISDFGMSFFSSAPSECEDSSDWNNIRSDNLDELENMINARN